MGTWVFKKSVERYVSYVLVLENNGESCLESQVL